MAYAKRTNVDPERTQAEIKRTLRRYGAESFLAMERSKEATIGFEIKHLAVRIAVSIPELSEFALSETGRDRSESSARAAHDQAIRQRWRALLLAIKAKLEAVETGISTLETEFMPFIVCPDGLTIGQHMLPKLEAAARDGKMPKLLPVLPGVG